ncbi:site-specific integrase [SAR202 cluster bacterium AC-647-N09_OGT_505m]|nr:site-specific integrase [SAR202 cluster bacterium AC-647-N09_OGT_505m]
MERRAQGEGTIRLRPDGRWEAKVRLELTSGTHKRIGVYGKTKGEVSRKMAEIRQRNKENTLTLTKPLTLTQYLASWWNAAELKPSSLQNRELNVRRVSSIIGDVRLDKLTPTHIRQVDNTLKDKGLSGASRRQAFAVLRTALRHAVIQGLIPVSPYARVTWTPRVELRAGRVLTTHEKAKLFSLNDRWTGLWKILLVTGMRSGEALGLTWEDVDLGGGRIHIRQTIQRRNGGYMTGTPKTTGSRRALEIRPPVVEVFKEIKIRQETEAERLGEAWSNEEGFVFTWHLGEPILGHNAHRALQEALQRIKAPPARVHDLRHTFASDQLLAGTPMSEVSRMLGHASVAFTLQIYTHILPEVQSKAAEAAADILEEAMRLAEMQGVGDAG